MKLNKIKPKKPCSEQLNWLLFSFIPNEDNKNLPVKTEKSDAIKKKIIISNIFQKNFPIDL